MFHDADLMLPSAQNKLLKTLEEPPEGICIFLGAVNTFQLLTTVKSRCQRLTVERFSQERIYSYLLSRGAQDADAAVLSASCFGNVCEAEAMIFDKEYFRLYETVFEAFLQMRSSKDALRYIALLQDYRDRFEDCLEIMTSLFRDVLVVKTNPDFLLYKQRKNDILEISKAYSEEAALGCLELIRQANRKWKTSCNFNAVLDQLILGILEVKQLCRKL